MTDTALDEIVRKRLAREEEVGRAPKGTGLAVGVVHRGEVRLSNGYGLRDRMRKLPVTCSTVFEAASLTKGFTAAALVEAAESNALDLDAPINEESTRIPLSEAQISESLTVADVLSHRCGLPPHDMLWYLRDRLGEDLRPQVARLGLLPDLYRGGFIYNNLMYGGLGHAFEDLVGEPWQDRVQRVLLDPLGMSATSFAPSTDESDVAKGYAGNAPVQRVDLSSVAAAGSIRSTVDDLLRWIMAHLEDGTSSAGVRVLGQETLGRMREPHVASENANPLLFQGLEWLRAAKDDYGLGWFLGELGGRRALYHPGLTDGFSIAVVLVPEERWGAIALTNLNLSPLPGTVIRDLVTESLPDLEVLSAPPPPDAIAPLLDAGTDAPDNVTGTYQHPAYGSVSIREEDNGLRLHHHRHAWDLIWTSKTTARFAIPAFGVELPMTLEVWKPPGTAAAIAIPLALDPRAEPETFTRG